MPLITPAIRLVALLVALVALLASAPAASALTVRTSAQKQDLILDMLEEFVPYAEGQFTASDIGVADTDFYDGEGSGVQQPRGAGAVLFAYATLLTGRPAQSTFGPTRVRRTTLLNHIEETIRHEVYTHVRHFRDVNGGDNPPDAWGDGEWQASPYTYGWAWAAQLLWSDLSRTTQDELEVIVKYEANYLLNNKVPEDREPGDSHSDDNGWNTGLLTAAAAMFPTDPNVDDWTEHAQWYAINASTITADRSDSRSIDGVQLRTWATTVNLNNDLTLVNHRFFHPTYSESIFQSLADSMIFFESVSYSIPDAFTFRLEEIWDDLLGGLMQLDGELVHPAGTDWVTHDLQHTSYLSLVAAYLQRDDASAMESVALEQLAGRQAANGDGSILGLPSSDFGYEADGVQNLAAAWWTHELFGSAPTPSQSQIDAARAAFAGVHQYTDVDLIANNGQDALTVTSWDDDGNAEPSGQIWPSVRDHDADPTFMRNTKEGIWARTPGTVSGYSCDCRSDSYSTAATSTDGTDTRYMSMTSFDDGHVLLLDRGAGTVGGTFRFRFENVDGMTGDRFVYSDDGTWDDGDGPTNLTGNWVNVQDRFGMNVVGGGGIDVAAVSDDTPYIHITGSIDAGTRNRGAVILPLASAQETALAAQHVAQPTVSDSLWSAVTGRALDGTARIAVGRWGGSGTATVSNITSPLGAPIPDRPEDITVNGRAGSTSVTLGSPASAGWKGYFWVESTNAVTVLPISEGRIRITNGGSSSTVTVRYIDDGEIHVAQATLAGNAVAYGRELDDGVAIVTPASSSSAVNQPHTLAYDGSTGTHWASTSTRIGAGSPQTLTLDYGAMMDMEGAVMTPVSGAGPRDYEVLTSPDGSTWTTRATERGVGNSQHTSTFASAIRARYLQLRITASNQAGDPTQVKVSELRFRVPTIDVDLVDPLATAVISGDPQVRLANGGYNEPLVRLRNAGGSSRNVTVGVSGLPSGVRAAFHPSATVSVPAGGTADVYIRLTTDGRARTSGASDITVTATDAASETLEILHTDNLALNDVGTAYPRAIGQGEDPTWLYPASLATDADTTGGSNFWVSSITSFAGGDEVCLVIDLGVASTVGRAVMTPRRGWGPKDYTVQTANSLTDCATTSGWTTRDTERTTDGTVTTSSWTPVSARYVRLRISSNHDSSGPYSAQVRELELYPS